MIGLQQDGPVEVRATCFVSIKECLFEFSIVSSSSVFFSNEKIEFPRVDRQLSWQHTVAPHNRWNPLKAKNDDSADGTSNDL